MVVPAYPSDMVGATHHIACSDADFTNSIATSFASVNTGFASGQSVAKKYNATLDQYSTISFTNTYYVRASVLANKLYLFGATSGFNNVAYSVDLGTGTRTAIAANASLKIGGSAVVPASSSQIIFIGGSDSGATVGWTYPYGTSSSLPASPETKLSRSVSTYYVANNTYSVDAFSNILPIYMDFGITTLANKVARIANGVYILCPLMTAGLADSTWTMNTTGRLWRLDLNAGTCVEIDAIGVSQTTNTGIGFAGGSKVITDGGILYDDALATGSKLLGQVRNNAATGYTLKPLPGCLLLGSFVPCLSPGLFRVATAGEVSMNFTNFTRLVYARRNA
jgi:hypothetical protein